MRFTPINMTVGPVTIGGKIFCKNLGGKNEMRISSREQTAAVPRSAPYALGHGRRVPSASLGQYPLSYICANAPVATGMMANVVPTTEMRPVPM